MQKAQGSLEYLLLIGGAILVGVIAIAIIINITASGEDETLLAAAHGLCSKFQQSECPLHEFAIKNSFFVCYNTPQNNCRAFNYGKNLVAFLRMNGNATDAKNNYTTVINGNTNCSAAGKFGQGCEFDGTGPPSDYITIDLGDYSDEYVPPGKAIPQGTIAMWVYNPGVGAGLEQDIISRDTSRPLVRLLSANRVLTQISNGLSYEISTAANVLIPEWNHIVFVWGTPQFQRIYVNGALKQTGSYQGTYQFRSVLPSGPAGSNLWVIGKPSNSDTKLFSGTLDDVAIWDRALSPQEIQMLYQLGAT